MPWALIGLSFYASNMSGASFVGLMGAAYAHGMAVFNYEWTAVVVLIALAVFMLPVFLRTRIFTTPEYLEARFDRRSRWLYAGFTLLTLMLIDTAGALYAGGVVIATAFPQLSLSETVWALAAVSGVYTIFGGLRAVIFTDAAQAVLVIAGAAAICILGLQDVGGWHGLTSRLDAASLRLYRPVDDGFLPWPGIFGVILLGFYYWTVNQYFVQRALAARSLDAGRKGALFGGLLKLPNLFLMIIPGMIAAVLLPKLGNADQAFPALAFEIMPVGVRGLILAALVAAIMSSLDSALNAASSMLTMDFVRPLRPGVSDRALFRIGRLFTTALMLAAALYAPLIASFGSLFTYFQSTLAYLVPPVVAVYLGGLLIGRFTATAAFWSLVVGMGSGIALFVAKEVTGLWSSAGLPAVHFTYMAIVVFAVTLATLTVTSLATAPADGRGRSAATVGRADLRPTDGGRGPWRSYRVQAAVLAAATAAIVVALW
jgi:SSS family solute:Na+ symporter